MGPFFLKCLEVAALMAVIDVVWAVYIRNVAAANPMKAALAASGMILMSSVVTLSYVEDRRLVLPAAVGAFVGTWAVLRFKR